MSRPPAVPRFYDSEHERQRIREERNKPRTVLRKNTTTRPRDLQIVPDHYPYPHPPPPSQTHIPSSSPPTADNSILAWVDRFVAPPPSTPRTLHVQVNPESTTIRNVPERGRNHARRPSAQEVQERLRQLPSSPLPRSNSYRRPVSNSAQRRHQPGTADLHLRLNVRDDAVWDGSQEWMPKNGPGARRPPLPPPNMPVRPPRPSNVNLFDDEYPITPLAAAAASIVDPPPLPPSSKRPPPLSFASTSSGQSSRNGSPQTPTTPSSSQWVPSYYYTAEPEQQPEMPLPPLPRSPPASMGFGRRALSPPAPPFASRSLVSSNLTGGTTASGSLGRIGELMTASSMPEGGRLSTFSLNEEEHEPSPFSEHALSAREEEKARERELRRSASRRATTGQQFQQLPPPSTAQFPSVQSIPEEPERQNAFSRLRDFTRARSKSLGRESAPRAHRTRTPSPPPMPIPRPRQPTSPVVATPTSARTIRPPASPKPLYNLDFLAPHESGPPSRPHSVAVSESSVITAGGTRYNIKNKALRVVNPTTTTASSIASSSPIPSPRTSIVSRSSIGSTLTALFSHSTSSKSSVTSGSGKSGERLRLEAEIYKALRLPQPTPDPYSLTPSSASASSRGASPLPPPSIMLQDYSHPSSPRTRLVDVNTRLDLDVRRALDELTVVEEEAWGQVEQKWARDPDLECTDDAAMGLETLVRVERKKAAPKRPERRCPVALMVPRQNRR